MNFVLTQMTCLERTVALAAEEEAAVTGGFSISFPSTTSVQSHYDQSHLSISERGTAPSSRTEERAIHFYQHNMYVSVSVQVMKYEQDDKDRFIEENQ